MARLPTEPEAFAEQVASILRTIEPRVSIDAIRADELVVDGHRLNLENLRHQAAQEEDQGTAIATEFLRWHLADDQERTSLIARLPTDPEAFAVSVARILTQIQPERRIDAIRANELVIDGHELDLENLRRQAALHGDLGTEIVEEHLSLVLSKDAYNLRYASLEFAKPRIMPCIDPEGILDYCDREQAPHIPFLNKTVITFVIDTGEITVPITAKQMRGWGVTAQELYELAVHNLAEYVSDEELILNPLDPERHGAAYVFRQDDCHTAARILLPSVQSKMFEALNGKYSILIPSRDVLIVYSFRDVRDLAGIMKYAGEIYTNNPHPRSMSHFEVILNNGVVGFEGVNPPEGTQSRLLTLGNERGG